MRENSLQDMKYGIEVSESLIEILSVLRDARNMISDFTSEHAAYLGVDNVRVLNRIHSTIQESMSGLNVVGEKMDSMFHDLAEGSKRVPQYNMQLFRNELISFKNDSHVFLTLPDGSGYGGWNVKLSNKFITEYSDVTEWRFYPKSTTVFLHKYADDGSRETIKIDGARFAEVLNRCNRVLQIKIAEDEALIKDLAIQVDDCMFRFKPEHYKSTYFSRDAGLSDTERVLKDDPEAVLSLLQSINDEEAILLSKKIENTLFVSDGEVMEAKREN